MNIFLLRHGETDQNSKGTYYGKMDIDLNDNGIHQCQKVKNILKDISFDKVYTSTMKRTMNTAKHALEGRKFEIIKDRRLNEMDMGEFEGKTYKEIQALYPDEWKLWCDDWKNATPPKGENYIQFYGRVKNFINELKDMKEENILIVTHGGVIKNFYTYVLDENPDNFWKFSTNNCDLALIKYEYGNFYIDFIIKNKFL